MAQQQPLGDHVAMLADNNQDMQEDHLPVVQQGPPADDLEPQPLDYVDMLEDHPMAPEPVVPPLIDPYQYWMEDHPPMLQPVDDLEPQPLDYLDIMEEHPVAPEQPPVVPPLIDAYQYWLEHPQAPLPEQPPDVAPLPVQDQDIIEEHPEAPQQPPVYEVAALNGQHRLEVAGVTPPPGAQAHTSPHRIGAERRQRPAP
eukprot:TRINITY_DN3328_c0_g1_i5.p2 TRINITY_DN3328_c0_g1~~TRINITY_DN3328_c0_g1_i5.p2  ORF type:complete len:199 (-),score=33.75 TRINITY_DN3328_c0_g1_i5:542-1138(-)